MKAMITVEQSFEELVDSWVEEAISRGTTSFEELLSLLPGVYPLEAARSLTRLAVKQTDAPRKILTNAFEIADLGQQGLDCNNITRHRIALPMPHPLDYDWRFGQQALVYLLNLARSATQPDEKVLLLGAPSVLRAALECSYPRQITLLNANQAIMKCFAEAGATASVEQCDLLHDALPNIEASVVIADPPWYEEHLKGFMWASSRLCAIGGQVFVSLPPLGTRPGIEQERETFLEWAQRLGFELLSLEPAALPYRTPIFEANALIAAGFKQVWPEWRRGDLAVFVSKARTQVARPRVPRAIDNEWLEGELHGIRVRVRKQEATVFYDPQLLTIVPGDMFPSVSRRDERRALVDVWTSGNRVFACHGRNILSHILHGLATGVPPEHLVEASLRRRLNLHEGQLIRQAVEQVVQVINQEQTESLLFGDN